MLNQITQVKTGSISAGWWTVNEFRMKRFIKEFTKYFGKPFHDAIDSDDREDK